MNVELHSHTHYSQSKAIRHEGLNSPKEMVEYAKKIGLGAIAITDHNMIKGSVEAKKFSKKYGIVILKGEEVTTEKGHILAIGINEEIKPKLSVIETIELIHEQGGIAIASHPFDIRNKGIGIDAKKCDAMEAFNAMNLERIANWNAKKFSQKNSIPGVATSDAHCKEMLGYGITRVNACDEDSIIKEIKKGRIKSKGRYLPAKLVTDWTVTRLKISYSDVIDYMNENYSWPKRTVAKKMLSLVEQSPGNIDYLFKVMAYISMGGVIIYSASRELFGD